MFNSVKSNHVIYVKTQQHSSNSMHAIMYESKSVINYKEKV